MTVTASLRLRTSFGFSPINSAEELRDFALQADWNTTTVDAGFQGRCFATLYRDGEHFVLRRSGPNRTAIIHTLLIDATDADRLLAHWRGFAETAAAAAY